MNSTDFSNMYVFIANIKLNLIYVEIITSRKTLQLFFSISAT